MNLYIGKFVQYCGKEYQITSIGQHSIRLERGYGMEHSVIVLMFNQLSELH